MFLSRDESSTVPENGGNKLLLRAGCMPSSGRLAEMGWTVSLEVPCLTMSCLGFLVFCLFLILKYILFLVHSHIFFSFLAYTLWLPVGGFTGLLNVEMSLSMSVSFFPP